MTMKKKIATVMLIGIIATFSACGLKDEFQEEYSKALKEQDRLVEEAKKKYEDNIIAGESPDVEVEDDKKSEKPETSEKKTKVSEKPETSNTRKKEPIEYDKLQQLYLDINPDMCYPEVIELIESTGLHYSEAEYLRSWEIQVAFTKGATAQKYNDEDGDYITISYVYPDDKNGSIGMEEYLFATCVYHPCDCSLELIQHVRGSYWSYYDKGNYISDLGTDLELDTDMSKEEQLEYYFENKSTAKYHD